ncbi:MAG: OmpW family outer membrane protein [Odoribacter sp.]|nr:OmpW family outer membrane protein [Odoribacter sp.]
MKKLFILTLCLIGISPLLKAQVFNVNYHMTLPFSKVKDYTDKASFRGFDVEYHQFMSDNCSVGAAIGWDVFYQDKQKTSGNFRFNNDNNIYTITGNQYRYINTVPMLAIGRYYFTAPNSTFRPYFGVGVGTQWTEKKLEVGQYTSTVSRWQFALAPEIGTYISICSQFGFNAGVRYNYATKAAHGRVPEISSLTFNIGILLTGNQ